MVDGVMGSCNWVCTQKSKLACQSAAARAKSDVCCCLFTLLIANLIIIVIQSSYFFSVRIVSPVPCAVLEVTLKFMKNWVIRSLFFYRRHSTSLSMLHLH